MNTLSIPQIFSQFTYYQAHYLDILSDAERYYTPVHGAEIEIWPLKKQALYLGDLLQLWFAEKWLATNQAEYGFELFYNTAFADASAQAHYVYAISGNLLSNENTAKGWCQKSATDAQLTVVSVAKLLFEYKSLTRTKRVTHTADCQHVGL